MRQSWRARSTVRCSSQQQAASSTAMTKALETACRASDISRKIMAALSARSSKRSTRSMLWSAGDGTARPSLDLVQRRRTRRGETSRQSEARQATQAEPCGWRRVPPADGMRDAAGRVEVGGNEARCNHSVNENRGNSECRSTTIERKKPSPLEQTATALCVKLAFEKTMNRNHGNEGEQSPASGVIL